MRTKELIETDNKEMDSAIEFIQFALNRFKNIKHPSIEKSVNELKEAYLTALSMRVELGTEHIEVLTHSN